MGDTIQAHDWPNLNKYKNENADAFDFSWRQGLQPAKKIVALNKMIQNYADANELLYLDYYSAMVNNQKGLNPSYSDDGVHPNKAGYEVMNTLVENSIQLALH